MSTAGRSPIAERATPPWAGSIAAGDGGRRSWRRPWLSGLVTALVVMATAAVSIGIVAVAVRAVLLDDLRNYLRRTAETTAALIDGPRHALVTDSSQTGSPEYIRFAYTGTIRGDTSSFILDGDTSTERAWVGERDEPTVGEREIDRVRRTVVESTPTPTAWGIGIRAYAPIRTPPGAPFAYVGITMDANRYASWLRRVYETAALGLSVALLLALLSGLRAARSESARIRAELAIAEARATWPRRSGARSSSASRDATAPRRWGPWPAASPTTSTTSSR
jgi:hypothetical protein